MNIEKELDKINKEHKKSLKKAMNIKKYQGLASGFLTIIDLMRTESDRAERLLRLLSKTKKDKSKK